MSGLLISILIPGHDISLISNDEGGYTYGGQQMVCSCGWHSRVIGISDNNQFSNLRRAAQDHEDEVWRKKTA